MTNLFKQLQGRSARAARLLIQIAGALSVASIPVAASAQQGGSIEGKVVAADTRQPLSGVIVNVQGTARGAVTDAKGQYRIDGVPSGAVVVIARIIGRDPGRATVIVPPDANVSQDFALTQTAVRVGDVVVTASRDIQTKTEIPANIGVVGGADIQLARPHHSAEIVNRVPGVLNIDLGGEGSTVAMRLPINYSAVYGYLEDGVPIRSTGFFNHNALYEINVPGASRVEVFKGPATAMYGSDAIGGVFNVLTRAPSAGSDLELFAESAAHDYRRTLASVSNTWGSDGVRADLNAMHFGGWRDGAHQDRQTGTIRWDHALPADARLKTVVTFTNINSPGDGGSDISYSDFENRPSTNYTPIAMRKVKAFRWSTDYSKQMGSSGVDVTAYGRYNRLELLPFWQLTYDPQLWDANNRSLGLMAKFRRDFSRGNAIVGTDLDYSPGRNVEDEIIPTMTPNYVFNSYTKGQRQYDYDVTFRGASPYAQVELSPIDALHLSAGVRLDELEYVYDNKLSAVDTGAHRRPASTSVSYGHVSPKLGITYDVTSSVNVFASYRHGFRVPSEEQLFVEGSASNSVGLEPVRANSYEAGIRTALSRVSAELSAYSMDMTNDIVYFYNATTFTSEVSNAGRTRHRGVEAGVKVALTDQWRVESSYAYVRNRYAQWVTATGSDFSGNEMEAGPRTIANSRLSYAPSANSAVSAEWAHVGWYFTDADNLHRYNGYDVMNLELATPSRNGFLIVGRLANVTNKRYSVATSFNPFVPVDQQDRYTPGLQRTVYLGLQYDRSR
jgi:iron complex outermembrane receptor protein